MQSTRQSKTSPAQTLKQSDATKWLTELAETKLRKDALDAANSLLKVITEDTRLMDNFTYPALQQQQAVLQARTKLLEQCEIVKKSIAEFQEEMLEFNQKYSEETKKIEPKDVEAIKAKITAIDNEIKTLDADKKDYTTKNTSHTRLNRADVGDEFKKLDLSLVPTHKLIKAIQTKHTFRTDKAAKAIQTKMKELYKVLSGEIPQHIEEYNSSVKSPKGFGDAIAAYHAAKKKAAEDFNDVPFVQITKKQMAAEQRRTSAPASATNSSATNLNRLLSPKRPHAEPDVNLENTPTFRFV